MEKKYSIWQRIFNFKYILQNIGKERDEIKTKLDQKIEELKIKENVIVLFQKNIELYLKEKENNISKIDISINNLMKQVDFLKIENVEKSETIISFKDMKNEFAKSIENINEISNAFSKNINMQNELMKVKILNETNNLIKEINFFVKYINDGYRLLKNTMESHEIGKRENIKKAYKKINVAMEIYFPQVEKTYQLFLNKKKIDDSLDLKY